MALHPIQSRQYHRVCNARSFSLASRHELPALNNLEYGAKDFSKRRRRCDPSHATTPRYSYASFSPARKAMNPRPPSISGS
jgi:hypothetical protein